MSLSRNTGTRSRGTLSGFDRLVFRGTLRSIAHDEGMKRYLWANQVLLKDFGSHVERVSRRLKEASLAEAEALGRPVKYLTSSQVSKEEIARGIAAQEGIRDGLVCVLSCVEPCWSFEIHRNREKKRLELEPRYRKCLFLYHYWMHPVFGFMNARIQTWFPFPVQICLNGREWLARQMDAAGLEYARQDNCFPWIADWAKAQRLMDRQLKANWPKLLDGVAKQLNPVHGEIFQKHPVSYYWSDVSERMGDRYRLPGGGGLAAAVPAAGAPRHDDLLQSGRDALPGEADSLERRRAEALLGRSGERPETPPGGRAHQA